MEECRDSPYNIFFWGVPSDKVRGLGKMRHLGLRDLLLQKDASDGKLMIRKIRGDTNPSDLMTNFE